MPANNALPPKKPLVYPFKLPASRDPDDEPSAAEVTAAFTYAHFKSFERYTTKSSAYNNDIYLYLPEKMTMPSTVKWDMTGIGIAGQQAENYMKGNKDSTIQSAAIAGGSAMMSHVISNTAKSFLDSSHQILTGNMYNSEHLAGLAAGGIPNPYMTMLFKGVDPRAFEFSFKFYPHSEADALAIDAIIEAFRADSLPPGAQSYNPVSLGYPMEFEIEYMMLGMTHPWLNKFKRSVITKLDVDYTGAGMWSCSTQTQFPTYIVLNLTFTELEIVLRDDVLAGY